MNVDLNIELLSWAGSTDTCHEFMFLSELKKEEEVKH